VAIDELAEGVVIGVGGGIGQAHADLGELRIGLLDLALDPLQGVAQVTRPAIAAVARLRLRSLARRGLDRRFARSRRDGFDPTGSGDPLDRSARLNVQAALGGVVLEVTGVEGRLAGVDLDDRVGDGSDQVAVMGDQHDRAGERVKRVLEHVARLDVEMVRRLVQAEQVGRVGHQLGQRQSRLLPTRQDFDLLLDRVAGEEEGTEQLPHLGRAHAGGGAGQLLEDGVGGVERLDLVLCEVGDPDVAAQVAAASLELQHPGQDLQQGALAGAVRADEGHLLAALQDQVEAVVHGVGAVSLDDLLERDDHAPASRRLGEPELDCLGALGRDLDRSIERPADPALTCRAFVFL
jgi:hypothetical protein